MSNSIEIETLLCPVRHKRSVKQGETITVGRRSKADFVVAYDEFMSGIHFQIEYSFAQATLKDMGSRNGTFVNGQAVTSTVISDQDQILAGTTVFVVSFVARPHVESTGLPGLEQSVNQAGKTLWLPPREGGN